MQIVVSGTHSSGKSTLISDFTLHHRTFDALPDPFELVDERWDLPDAALFSAQLQVAADRLVEGPRAARDVIAERGPIDFLAYLIALEDLGRTSGSRGSLGRATAITAEALGRVDLLVVLPLAGSDQAAPGPEEDLELRAAMNDALLDLIADPDVVPEHVRVVEIAGDRRERLSTLESVAGTIRR
jgi:hypothetical protein